MNFLGCDGTWAVGAAGEISCTGTLTTYTAEELGALANPAALSAEDVQVMTDATLALFVAVFGFLVIKKVL
ncbi:hypothetical protein D3C85_1309470 [compost metagenome]